MKKILLRVLLSVLTVSVAACSGPNAPFVGNVISVKESATPNPHAQQQKYAASIRVLPYSDGRNTGNPHKIGISSQIVFGMSGTELMVEPEVSAIVANSMRRRLDDAGFRLAEADALYELSGVIKVLTYDVKVRDEISIAVESTLKEVATGKVVWSGSVVEKSDRFAGVSGNNKQDIANYLREKVGVVTGKTAEAISVSLMASRPDLFNLAPGTRPIQGVTVLTAPSGNAAPAVQNTPPVIPLATAPTVANGVLSITSTPPRVKIYIDDVYYGLTPLRLELAAGVHNVSAKLAGHKTSAEKVSVRKGESTEMEIVLQR